MSLACVLRARLLTPARGGGLVWHADGRLVIGDDGRIAEVGPWRDGDAGGARTLDLRPSLIAPGFVDAHVHFPQARIVGSATGPLLDWLERSVFPEEARFAEEGYAREVARELVARLLAAGTTAAAIFSSSHPGATEVLFAELARAGMRAAVGLTLMDQACPEALRLPADRAMAASAALCERWHGHDRGRLAFAVTPRFAISCSRGMLEAAARFAADRRLLVQTHVAENVREGEETLAAHPWGADYLDVYDRVGLVGGRTLLAHAIHLSPDEWDRVAARGARIAHCPDSNFFLGSGRMRAHAALERGVPVGLGTDVAAGRTFSVRRVMGSAWDNALCVGQRVEPAALFHMATLGGAVALGIDDVCGSLDVGKDADLAVIDLPPWAGDAAGALAELCFATDDTRVRASFVRGRCVHGKLARDPPWR
jgi:guanine deaminase